jgi:glycosyltransferase involved in cell wall biosynthesis
LPASPLVSVVIPSYNCSDFIVEAVDSALLQTYRPCEIIVVDDGSTDQTRTVLSPYLGRIRYEFRPNRGVSVARNHGVRLAGGELVAFLDADDLWRPEKLERQVRVMRALPDCALVCTDGQSFGAEGIIAERLLSKRTRSWTGAHQTDDPAVGAGDLTSLLWFENCIYTSSTMLRRERLLEAGGFDGALTMAEDYDVWLRIASRHPCAVIDEGLVQYRWREGGLSGAFAQREVRGREGALNVLERRFALVPQDLRAQVHIHMANEYLYCANEYLRQGKRREARARLRDCLRHDGRSLRAMMFLVALLFGSHAMNVARLLVHLRERGVLER